MEIKLLMKIKRYFNFFQLFKSLFEQYFILQQLAKAEILTRYRGSILGVAWSILNPLFMLVVYSIVFQFLLKVRWAVETSEETPYALALFAGILIHSFFSDILVQATSSVSKHANFVKKIVFPLEVLPVVTVISSVFNLALSLFVFFLAILFFGVSIHLSLLLIPILLLPFIIFVLAMAYLLAAVGVYIKDISQVAGMLSTMFLFLSPVLYPLSVLPEGLRSIAMLNPLSFMIEQLRLLSLNGGMIDWHGYIIYCFVALGFLSIAYAVFQKTRKGFADVI